MTLELLNASGTVSEWNWDVYDSTEDAECNCEAYCESYLIDSDGILNQETRDKYGLYTIAEAYQDMEKHLSEGTIVRLWNLRRGTITEREPGEYEYEGQPNLTEWQVMKNGSLEVLDVDW